MNKFPTLLKNTPEFKYMGIYYWRCTLTRKKKVLDESDENLLVLKGSLCFFIEETVGYLGSKDCDLCKRDDLVESGVRLLAELEGREFMELENEEE